VNKAVIFDDVFPYLTTIHLHINHGFEKLIKYTNNLVLGVLDNPFDHVNVKHFIKFFFQIIDIINKIGLVIQNEYEILTPHIKLWKKEFLSNF
jgi:hypothetical protein